MDKIADMLVAVKNAGMVGKTSVSIPYSTFRHEIAKCLLKHDFIAGVQKKAKKGFSALEISLKTVDKRPRITDIRRVSKPSRRIYVSMKDLQPVKHGFGMLVLSTPKGILADSDAKEEHVGGEALFEIW